MSPKRRNNGKKRNRESERQSERPRKIILDGEEIPASDVSADKNTNLLQVIIRFKKVDYYSVTPKTFEGDILVVNFMLKQFDLEFFRFPQKSILFFYDDYNVEKVAKVTKYSSIIEDGVVSIKLELNNIIDKTLWDKEWMTEEYFYNEYVLGLNKFWQLSGEKLDELIKPLGLARKSYEDDIMLKRRIVSYIQASIKPTNNIMDMLNNDLNKKSGNKE